MWRKNFKKKKLKEHGENLACQLDWKAMAEAGKKQMKTKRKKKEDNEARPVRSVER